jgi:hypothetical protein
MELPVLTPFGETRCVTCSPGWRDSEARNSKRCSLASSASRLDCPMNSRESSTRPEGRVFFQDLERIRSGPPVPGYEAFLIDEGYEPFEAHLIGHAMNNLGMRVARLNWFDFKDYGCPIGSGVVGSLRGGQPSLRGPLGKPTGRHITPPAPRQTPAC